MIKKPSTSKVMDVFENAVNESEKLETALESTKEALQKKLDLMDIQYEYALHSLVNLNSRPAAADGKIILCETEKYGRFDSFGMTVHPKLSKEPRNLFNYLTTRGYLFKDNVTTKINTEENTHLKESLKHDSLESKTDYIDKFDTDVLDISIEPDLKTPLGSLKCNMLEFQPFLPGSFNIEYINIYSRDNLIYPAHVLSGGITNVGAQRIILSEKVDIGKVEFRVKLLYKDSEGKYPFGMKHLYFQEANFVNGSYVVVRADSKQDIDYIYDKLAMKTQDGSSKSESSKDWGIRYYTAFDGENLSHEVETSTATSPSIISMNTKAVYLYIPLSTSIISVTPTIVSAS